MMEIACLDALGWGYSHAHEVATGFERRHVVGAGLDWPSYQKCMKRFIKHAENEKLDKVPGDLDMKPYHEEPVDHKLIARMEDAMGDVNATKVSKESVDYSPGHAHSHCGPMKKWPKGDCLHFIKPHSCELVRGYIKPADWCGLWNPVSHEETTETEEVSDAQADEKAG
jgi:hypothetical protein